MPQADGLASYRFGYPSGGRGGSVLGKDLRDIQDQCQSAAAQQGYPLRPGAGGENFFQAVHDDLPVA